ncbi:MAG: PKD domain-containing protein, partial [Rhizobiaceae bacterium]|nr:PKD domain-containing protein [Rhizobiaceae bacterium]
FGDGATGAGAVSRHAFAQPGVYRVQLQANASAAAGGCSSTKAVHVLTVNAAPVADPGPDRSVEVGQELLLSGAASHDPDGGIAAYDWDFGDGEKTAGVEVRHIWRKPGQHRVTLKVDDGSGVANAVTEKSFVLSVADKPKVAIDAIPVACVGRPVAFGLANLPEGVDQAGLSWAFGDGVSEKGGKVSHAYVKPGTYTVGIAGPMDRAGAVETTVVARKIVVNQPPVAVIEAERKTCPGTEVSFDGSKSFDPDGSISGFAWDFGDGSAAAGAKVSHRFARPGTYAVRLTVTDSSGSACSAGVSTLSVFVDAPPVADAGPDATVSIGGSQDSFVLDAARSRDPDGDSLSFRWSLSNGLTLEGEKARILLTEPGSVIATLTASDPHGLACGASTDTIEIKATQRPKSALLSD